MLRPLLASLLLVSSAPFPPSSPLLPGRPPRSLPRLYTCPRPDLRKLLEGLGLQDPHGLLFKEMMTWVQGPERASKAALRKRCCQKLEEMVGQLKVWAGAGVGAGRGGGGPPARRASRLLPRLFPSAEGRAR